MNARCFYWLRIPFLNLLIVSVLGVIMRYKIVFSLPFVDQKHLLHAHSHFAFSGWITQALMTLLVAYLSTRKNTDMFNKYKWLLFSNLFTAYGMLVSFPFQGYGFFSILFSTLSIFTSWAFAIVYWRDLNTLSVRDLSALWFKAALLFNAISALGAFGLAGMMAYKIIHQNWYLSAIYFFLHFQYNGWFFFACMGLFMQKIQSVNKYSKRVTLLFWLFALSCIPVYFLSVLWLPIPQLLYVLLVVSAIAQVIAWISLMTIVYKLKKGLQLSLDRTTKWLLSLSAFAVSTKLLLQLGSTIPSLSTLAYGFRPIVIAYLHLILLGVITLFILGYTIDKRMLLVNHTVTRGIIIFVSGILINELLLMTQGIAALMSKGLPFINELLLTASFLLFFGLLILNIGIKYKYDYDHRISFQPA